MAKPEFIRFNTVKEYITDTFKMRSQDSAVKKFIKEIDSKIETALKEAEKLAKEDNRNTVMEEDIKLALEKHLGKRHLTWQELAEEIISQTPADLGKISNSINDYIEKNKKKTTRLKRGLTG
jgi:histone H3/H4